MENLLNFFYMLGVGVVSNFVYDWAKKLIDKFNR